MLSRTAWHLHQSLACDAFKKGKCSCSASQLTWTRVHVCLCPVHVHIHVSVVLCSVGNRRECQVSASQLSFMRTFASVRLLFLLSAAFCYDPWPRLAKSASQSSQTIVVGLCIWVTKQPLACSHAELCHASCWDTLSRSHKIHRLCAQSPDFKVVLEVFKNYKIERQRTWWNPAAVIIINGRY